jgi:hypothetical protein
VELIEIYELALRLHMTVHQLTTTMPYEEMLGWFYYFGQRPHGWQEDSRAAMIINAQGVDKPAHELFHSLATIKRVATETDSVNHAKAMQSSGFMAYLTKTAADNNIDWSIQ